MKLKNICIICAAVVITWLALLVMMWMGFNIDKIILATLMGMSVGAIATKYAHNMFQKIGITVFGFLTVWQLMNNQVDFALVFLAASILINLPFIIKPKKGDAAPDRFKDCC